MYWYVLFVRTGKERKIEQLLKKQLDTTVFMPFIPLHERIFKIMKTEKKELKPLFPSYVFIESDVSSEEFQKAMSKLKYILHDIVRVLRYGAEEIAMRESERKMLLSLCNDDYCIQASKGILIGDKICVTEGALKGLESILKKVNRHKKEAWIEVEFMGENRLLNVALDIVNKLE